MSDLTGIQSNWNVIKVKMKQKYGILTDSDLVWKEDKYDELLAKLNIILGVSKDELGKFILEHENTTA